MQNSERFFENRQCKFFPCHKLDGDFNCLFCYCPLYEKNPCPGTPTFIKKEEGRIIKRCTGCIFPHRPENYERIISFLRAKKKLQLEEYHHGGERQGISPELDFSVNTNPLGTPESVKSAIKKSLELCEKYPDGNCTELRKKLAEKMLVSDSQIVIGNGASELISLLVYAINPKKALLLSPTFSGYERSLKSSNCNIFYHNLDEKKDFRLDAEIFSSIKQASPDIIFLCNPNNPTGKMTEPEILEKIVELCEEKGIFFVVDECFIDFTERVGESTLRFVKNSPHLVVLNAFTKIYAMAGLRLGYLVSSNFFLVQRINFLKPEWNVSQISQIAGLAALNENDYIQKTRRIVKIEREYLSKELKALGFLPLESEANFILIKIPIILKEEKYDENPQNSLSMSIKLDDFLLKYGIFIRNCSNFKNLGETYYRLAVKNHNENKKLIEKMTVFSSGL